MSSRTTRHSFVPINADKFLCLLPVHVLLPSVGLSGYLSVFFSSARVRLLVVCVCPHLPTRSTTGPCTPSSDRPDRPEVTHMHAHTHNISVRTLEDNYTHLDTCIYVERDICIGAALSDIHPYIHPYIHPGPESEPIGRHARHLRGCGRLLALRPLAHDREPQVPHYHALQVSS